MSRILSNYFNLEYQCIDIFKPYKEHCGAQMDTNMICFQPRPFLEVSTMILVPMLDCFSANGSYSDLSHIQYVGKVKIGRD